MMSTWRNKYTSRSSEAAPPFWQTLLLQTNWRKNSNSGVLVAFLKTGRLLSAICEQISIQRRMSKYALTLQVRHEAAL